MYPCHDGLPRAHPGISAVRPADVLRLITRSDAFTRRPLNGEPSVFSPYRIGDGIRNTGVAARDNCLRGGGKVF